MLEKVISTVKEDNSILPEVNESADREEDSHRRQNAGVRAAPRLRRSRSPSQQEVDSKEIRKLELDNRRQLCKHPIVFKGLCGSCGEDVYKKFEDREINEHGVDKQFACGVRVTREYNEELSRRDVDLLLKNKKLVLLLDLDETLVHTCNRIPDKDEFCEDLIRYQIGDTMYFTKIRPYALEFLRICNELFEMHIASYGQRVYTHTLTQALDPTTAIFDDRVLSRDELKSSIHKTKNLTDLFPSADQFLIMVDDRADVWEYSDAHIMIRPFKYFRGVGDINSPTACPDESTDSAPSSTKDIDEIVDIEKIMFMPLARSGLFPGVSRCKNVFKKVIPTGNDNTLLRMANILKEIHSEFYEAHAKSLRDNLPFDLDIKTVMANRRRNVLAGEYILLSGVCELGKDPTKHWIFWELERFGAVGQTELTDETTVVVAANNNTEKVNTARILCIPVVTTVWLLECIYDWQKHDKELYTFENSPPIPGNVYVYGSRKQRINSEQH